MSSNQLKSWLAINGDCLEMVGGSHGVDDLTIIYQSHTTDVNLYLNKLMQIILIGYKSYRSACVRSFR